MKASEVIRDLSDLICKHGDLETKVTDNRYPSSDEEISDIRVEPAEANWDEEQKPEYFLIK